MHPRFRRLLTASFLALVLFSAAIPSTAQFIWRYHGTTEGGASAAEFSRLVRDLSEDGGYFRSDNFTSNETSYLHIIDKLRELGASGGAYIGVGPEQNFTYIAKVRPRIAFIVDIHRRNLIIPLVGDFAGKKALASIGDYLRKNGYTVSAFYTSNVEQYLFQNGVFGAFAENVRKLPINEKSLFIRAVPNTRFLHPAQVPGRRITTLLQQMSVFLRDYDEARYQSYNDLVLTHYIAAEGSR